jgi:hypothetical protein
MTALTLMAQALDQELQSRGIFSLGRSDCEAIIAAVVERTAKAAEAAMAPAGGPPSMGKPH